MSYLRSTALFFIFIISFSSTTSASELTLRFRSGHSVSDIKLKYYRNDIFILRRGDKTEELISVDSLVYIRSEAGPRTVSGIVLGASGGGVIGGLIGRAAGGEGGGHPDFGSALSTLAGVAAGIVFGGVVGGIIGASIRSDETIDLSDAELNFKIETLKKFSR